MIATLIMSVPLNIVGGFNWFVFVFSTGFVLLVELAAATVGYLRRARSPSYTLAEIVRRGRPGLPPLAQVDPHRPLIGVGMGGAYEGCIALIKIRFVDGVVHGSIAIEVNPSRFASEPYTGFRDAPIDELKKQLASWQIFALPQSAFSDRVARSVFGKFPSSR